MEITLVSSDKPYCECGSHKVIVSPTEEFIRFSCECPVCGNRFAIFQEDFPELHKGLNQLFTALSLAARLFPQSTEPEHKRRKE